MYLKSSNVIEEGIYFISQGIYFDISYHLLRHNGSISIPTTRFPITSAVITVVPH